MMLNIDSRIEIGMRLIAAHLTAKRLLIGSVGSIGIVADTAFLGGVGEIVPVAVLEMDKISNGANGLIGVKSPAFPGISWSTITPLPYYYLILALIAFSIFANIRWRDSRFGRVWLATSEDEVAAAASGINLVNTKLFAFAAGAFFSGIAGAYHAAKLGIVSPDDFNFGLKVKLTQGPVHISEASFKAYEWSVEANVSALARADYSLSPGQGADRVRRWAR